MLTFLTFFIILSILVLIHELGHFITAKKSGVYVEEFGFGLPPRLLGKKIGETIYSINALPFGGFVKLFGEDKEDLIKNNIPPEKLARSFTNKSARVKSLIIASGVICNFLLGWIIVSYLFTQGVPSLSPNPIIEVVQKNSPAEKANLRKGDIIIALIAKNKKYTITSAEKLSQLTRTFAEKKIILIISRNGKEIPIAIIPRKVTNKKIGPLGVIITNYKIKKYPIWKAPFVGLAESAHITLLITAEITKALLNIITFKTTQIHVTGPIGIATLTGEASKYGINALLQLLGLLSLNLAVVNFLPFPALDGGRFIMIFYEAVTKKKINPTFERRLNYIGFAILIGLLIIISIKDIQKFL